MKNNDTNQTVPTNQPEVTEKKTRGRKPLSLIRELTLVKQEDGTFKVRGRGKPKIGAEVKVVHVHYKFKPEGGKVMTDSEIEAVAAKVVKA